jgi:hypothetical protein
MRVFSRLALALVLIGMLAARADAVPADKLSHFAFGVLSGGIATAVVDHFVPPPSGPYWAPDLRLIGGAMLGTVPGLIVEIGDSTGKAGFSSGDLLADFIGSTVGALITDKIVLHFFFDDRGENGEKTYGVQVDGSF